MIESPLDGGAWRDRSAWGAVTVAIGYFVLLAGRWPERPALYYDEASFVHAALGGNSPHMGFVTARIHGLPIMIFPYIGALKSYLFAPIFALFGVSIETVRYPAVGLSAVSLLLAFLLGRRLLGRAAAVVLVIVMASSPTFALLTRVDWGPTVLPMLLKIAALLAFFRLLDTRRIRHLWGLLGLLLLGLYDKQDFLWFIVALTIAALALYRQPLRALARDRPAPVASALGAFVVASVVFGYVFLLPNLRGEPGTALQNPLPHLLPAWQNYQGTLGYADLQSFLTGQEIRQPWWMSLAWVPMLGCLALLGVRVACGPRLPDAAAGPSRAAVFFLMIGAVMLVEIAGTGPATGPHHVIELWPFQDLTLLCSAVGLFRFASVPPTPRRRWLPAIALVLAAIAVGDTLAAQAVSTRHLVSILSQPAHLPPTLNPDLYRDSAFLNANAGRVDEILMAGWGQGTPLFALACPRWRDRYHDDWPELVNLQPGSARTFARETLGDRRVLVVFMGSRRIPTRTSLQADPAILTEAYRSVYPSRSPAVVLSTAAYDVVYYGPPIGPFADTPPVRGC